MLDGSSLKNGSMPGVVVLEKAYLKASQSSFNCQGPWACLADAASETAPSRAQAACPCPLPLFM